MKFFNSALGLLLACTVFSCEKDPVDPDPSTLKEGLLLWMPFSGNLKDSSGNNNHGSGFGTLTYNDNRYFDANGAVEFDGTTSRVEVPSQKFENLSAFTFYMEFSPRTSEEMVLLSKTFFAVPSSGIMHQSFNVIINHDLGSTRFNMKKSGHCDDHNTATAFGPASYGQSDVLADCWNYIAVTFDGTTIKTYLNGDLVAQGTEANAKICGGGSPLQIGAWWQGYGQFFSGKIDELRIYNRAITETEVKQLYKLP